MSEFRLKSIRYNGSTIKIISQNINGPCPILGIANVLLLNGKLSIPQHWEQLQFQTLAQFLAEFIVTQFQMKGDFTEDLSGILDLIPRLERGLDVNVHFERCDAFEFTSASSVFDICDVKLYHGWVIPPTNTQEFELICKTLKSYNAVVECIVHGDGATDDESITKAAVCDEFLKHSASQLTNFGILQLLSTLPEDRPSVLFRNNHFSTLIRRDSKLFILITDEGLLNEQIGKKRPAVWESLDSAHGGSSWFDADFLEIEVIQDPELPTYRQSVDGLDPDLLYAMQLQDEDHRIERERRNPDEIENNRPLEDSILRTEVADKNSKIRRASRSSSSLKGKCQIM